MSEFHYVRTLGTDGGVDACEGPAIGLDLETVLSDGLPPWRVALEIIAALCEILDIAEDDGEIHGDVHPKYVFIDETGAVSLEGFGVKRARTRAPEGTPKDVRSDLYGLGYTAFRVISSYPLPERLPDDDPDGHDDAIIDAALEIDLSQVPDEMQGDIQWFIAKLMAFDREDRPSAVEAWRTFIAFAHELEGPEVGEWCAAALDGGGARRAEAAAERAFPTNPEPTDEEDLGGPMVAQGPLSGKKITFDDGGSQPNKGATAFWTRDQMKKALDKVAVETDTQEEGPPMGIGGGTATNFWSRDQLDAMARGDQAAPRPRRAEGEGERRRATAAQRIPEGAQPRHDDPATGPLAPALPPRQGPVTGPPPQLVPPLPPPSPPQQEPVYVSNPGPSDSYPPSQSPMTWEEPYPPPAEPEGGGGLKFVLFGGGVAAFSAAVLAIVVVILFIVLIVVMSGGGDTATGQPVPIPTPTPPTPVGIQPDDASNDGGTPDGTPPPVEPSPTTNPTPKPPPKPAGPKPKPPPKPVGPKPPPKPVPTRPTPTPTPPKPTPKPPPVTPTPVPDASGDARVQLRSSGRGRVTGCSGSSVEFDGFRNFVIEAYKLPATCLVEIDGARGVFQVVASGDVTCDKQGTAVMCDKQQVP